jgi:hypothetical protein
MSSNAYDIEKPATESDIAEAIMVSDPDTADTIRRLAYERDELQNRCARDRLIHTLDTALKLACSELSTHRADDHPNDIFDQLMAEAKEPTHVC